MRQLLLTQERKGNINLNMSNHSKRISVEVIAACAAQATEEAYLKALNSGKEIATIVNGKVVKYRKNDERPSDVVFCAKGSHHVAR